MNKRKHNPRRRVGMVAPGSILFAYYQTATQRHDRMLYSATGGTMKEAFDWVQRHRKEIEKQVGSPAVVVDFKIING